MKRPGLRRRKRRERCELWARRRFYDNRHPKCAAISSSDCSEIPRFQILHECTWQVWKCSWWSNWRRSNHVFQHKTSPSAVENEGQQIIENKKRNVLTEQLSNSSQMAELKSDLFIFSLNAVHFATAVHQLFIKLHH